MRLRHSIQLHHCKRSRQKTTAADYLSRLEISPKEKLFLRIGEVNPTTPLEQIFYTEDDDETEEQTWHRKKQARDNLSNDLPDISFEKFTTHNSKYQHLSICQKLTNINAVAIEQNNDVILQQLKFKIQKEDYCETILLQGTRYQHYLCQLDRMSIQGEIITRQYYDETGIVKYNQILLPKHLGTELLEALHGKANGHPGIAKIIQENRSKSYCPGIAKLVRKWVNGCETCIKDKKNSNDQITPEILNLPEWTLGPEEAMQIDLLPNLQPSGGYENIITAIDVFSRYLFANRCFSDKHGQSQY